MATQLRPFISAGQYLEHVRGAEDKSEYFDGEVFAMEGAKKPHNILAGNVLARIHGAFRNRDCMVFGSDLRVCVEPENGLYTYPDVSAVCGESQFLDGDVDTLLNPTLTVEVLSRSTEIYDCERKFQRYKGIRSLRQYVLIASERVQVEVWTRDAIDRWTLKSASSPNDLVQLTTIDCSFTISELYEKTGLLR